MQDPIRKFVGREKYKRQLWATSALENPITVILFLRLLHLDEFCQIIDEFEGKSVKTFEFSSNLLYFGTLKDFQIKLVQMISNHSSLK